MFFGVFIVLPVIVASFLPIYVLSGPSGRLFKPMADTTIFALVGSLLAVADESARGAGLGEGLRRIERSTA